LPGLVNTFGASDISLFINQLASTAISLFHQNGNKAGKRRFFFCIPDSNPPLLGMVLRLIGKSRGRSASVLMGVSNSVLSAISGS
jgi:hypothetical protein